MLNAAGLARLDVRGCRWLTRDAVRRCPDHSRLLHSLLWPVLVVDDIMATGLGRAGAGLVEGSADGARWLLVVGAARLVDRYHWDLIAIQQFRFKCGGSMYKELLW